MPVFIGIENPDPSRSISKTAFEELIKENKNTIPKDIELVILMCAGWSCSAAKNYCEDRGWTFDVWTEKTLRL